ncbi:MAG: glycoside hydrolase family 97 protein [Melioribacteraceae bacterium]|nr:glycoside hydrolase family 97 protein [Melioribacteraceae bacterium]MCF8265090.1 glycoside hydrolase family 97 protein [Melioribacteraceae bacterium]
MLKTRINLTILLLVIFCGSQFAQKYDLNSPDSKLRVGVTINTSVNLSVYLSNSEIVTISGIELNLDNDRNPGVNPKVVETTFKKYNEKIFPVVREKNEVIPDIYNELEIRFERQYSLKIRAYDNGIAYRFTTNYHDSIIVFEEKQNFIFPENHSIYFPEEESFITHSERLYDHTKLSKINGSRFCSLPTLIELENNAKVLILEADIENYAGMYLRGDDKDSLSLIGIFPKYPKKEELKRDRDFLVTERENFIAKSEGARNFPWRILAVSQDDKELLTNQLVYQLAPENRLTDCSWIKPGKVAWDWWNYNNIYNVDFRAGVNTKTYKFFIDFAADAGLDYIILDEGWYELGDLTSLNPEIEMDTILTHAKERGIGVILWVVWKTLDDQLTEALNLFQEWGVAGIKVDFMQRDDQKVVDYYYRVAEEAAKRKMLVDFHGSYKPAGIRRAFPNVITREGVKGLENCKWSDEASPINNLIIPFTRMVAGPMDYTPGAMINATKENFREVFTKPMSLGTRCHQLAMYVVYESPLQMLADSPTHYLKEKESLMYLSKVPTIWDETMPIDAKVGEYVLIARRSGENWFVGAMTNWEERDLVLDLGFLDEGKYIIEYYRDGINADRNAEDYKFAKTILRSDDEIRIHMAPGGGWAAFIYKTNNNSRD